MKERFTKRKIGENIFEEKDKRIFRERNLDEQEKKHVRERKVRAWLEIQYQLEEDKR